MIFTSYFANWRKLNAGKIEMISIAQYPPPKVKIYNFSSWFAPNPNLLSSIKSGNIDWNQYVETYKAQINSIPKEVLDDLVEEIKSLEKINDIALCCYEKPSDNCHRHILADILNEKYNLNITEY